MTETDPDITPKQFFYEYDKGRSEEYPTFWIVEESYWKASECFDDCECGEGFMSKLPAEEWGNCMEACFEFCGKGGKKAAIAQLEAIGMKPLKR